MVRQPPRVPPACRPGRAPAPGGPCRPYYRSAELYEALLGRDMLPLFIRNFETLVRRYGARFRAVADVGCGTGGFVRYLGRRGVPVFGVDVSPEMIAIARRRGCPARGAFLVQDMRQLRLPCRVDLLTCNFDVLNYLLTEFDLERTFRRFNRTLTRGGHLLFDMVTDAGTAGPPCRRLLRVDAPRLTSFWTVTVDPRRRLRRVVMRHVVTGRDGARRREREVHTQRAYPVPTIVAALRRCGFVVRGMHDASTLLPARPRDRRVVFVAMKTRSQAHALP